MILFNVRQREMDFLYALAVVFVHVFGQIAFIRLKSLCNTNQVALQRADTDVLLVAASLRVFHPKSNVCEPQRDNDFHDVKPFVLVLINQINNLVPRREPWERGCQIKTQPVPGSEIVGSAELRKRKHENKTARQLFAYLFLSRLPHYLRAWNRLIKRQNTAQETPRALAYLGFWRVFLNTPWNVNFTTIRRFPVMLNADFFVKQRLLELRILCGPLVSLYKTRQQVT